MHMAVGEDYEQVGPFHLFGEPDHVHWARGAYDTSFERSRRGRTADTLFKIFGPLKISIFRQNMMFLAQNLDFFVIKNLGIDLEGRMIPQNDTLNEADRPNHFWKFLDH